MKTVGAILAGVMGLLILTAFVSWSGIATFIGMPTWTVVGAALVVLVWIFAKAK